MAVIWCLRMMKPVIMCQAWLGTGAKEAAEVRPNPRHAKLIFKNRNGKAKGKASQKVNLEFSDEKLDSICGSSIWEIETRG